jgi:hypothetical protein
VGLRRDSLQYGGENLRRASLFLGRVVPGVLAHSGSTRGRSLAGIRATASLLTSLPRLHVSLTDSPAGERLNHHFGDRIWGIRHSRVAQGVLVVPEQEGLYLRGRSRQALRTGIRRARADGITCRALHGVEERRAVLQHLDMAMSEWDEGSLSLAGDVWRAAFSANGVPVAVARMTVDVELALLQTFVSSHMASRYLLHAELVETLVSARVRYLAVNAPMAPLLEPTLQYWQRLLGFQVANLSLTQASPSLELQPTRETRVETAMYGTSQAG